MVKPQVVASPKRPSSLRADMKRKLPLPAPFVVSRGYTPEYPWLGQQHPPPEPGRKKPKLLMQQSPASIFKCIFCVACFILGLALIAYAGSTILRNHAARRSLESKLESSRLLQPQAAALVHDAAPTGRKTFTNVHDRRSAAVGDEHGTASPLEHAAPKATTAGDRVKSAASVDGPADVVATLESLDDGFVRVGDTAEHGPIVVRMVDEPRPAEPVIQRELLATPEEDPKEEEEAEPAVSVSFTEEGPEVHISDQEALQEAGQGSFEAARQLLLLARMANIVEAQRELEQRVLVTDVLKEAYDRLEGAGDTGSEQEMVQEREMSDGPILYDLVAEQGSADQTLPGEVVLDPAADAELAKQLLLLFAEALEQQEPMAETDTLDDRLPVSVTAAQEVDDGVLDATSDAELVQKLLSWAVAHPEAVSEQEPVSGVIDIVEAQGTRADDDEVLDAAEAASDAELAEKLRLWAAAHPESVSEQEPVSGRPEGVVETQATRAAEDEVLKLLQVAKVDAEFAQRLLMWAAAHPEALSEQETVAAPQEYPASNAQADQEVDDEVLDAASDAELAQKLLMWVAAHPRALSEQEQVAPPQEKRTERVAAARGVADEPVPAAQHRSSLSHNEQDDPESVSWTQLNEDDKQDALMPKLAARGLDGDDLPTAESKPAAGTESVQDASEHGTETQQGHGLPELEEQVDESEQLQQYRDLLSRRVPLMHHVLQLRRSQQETLQQEQRAAAYLQLLDLHLLQHRQEAAARQRRRQHLRDMQRLQAYARQLQQQDQQLHAQQVWWGQQDPQAYAQQAQADLQLYNRPTQQQASTPQQQQCRCPHRAARGAQTYQQSPQSAW